MKKKNVKVFPRLKYDEKLHESSPKASIFKKVHERHIKLKMLYRASMSSKQMEHIKE